MIACPNCNKSKCTCPRKTDPPCTDKDCRICDRAGYPVPNTFDPVFKPKHYNVHPSGIECIQVTEHLNFCVGNAIKYLWRAGQKGSAVEDLRKAVWYIEREIARIEASK